MLPIGAEGDGLYGGLGGLFLKHLEMGMVGLQEFKEIAATRQLEALSDAFRSSCHQQGSMRMTGNGL